MGFVLHSTPGTPFQNTSQTDLNSLPPNLYSTPDHHTLPLSSLSHNSSQTDLNSTPTNYSTPLQSLDQIGPHSSSQFQSTIETRRGEAEITDSVSMGAEEMMQLSKDIINDDIFVTGKTSEGKFINVDLQRDSVIPETINYAIDIDSLIWITRKPHFALAVELYTSPVLRNTAPISKDNHVKIEMLYPPVEQGKRDEWWSRSFRLSRLPHALLGKIGIANLSIFLPRMAHQDPYTSRWANVVPPEVQTQLWEKILMKALRRVIGDIGQVYIGENQAHISFKSSSHTKMPKTHPVRKSHFERMVEEMHEIIQDDAEGHLAQFGSFFFALEIKGCKMVSQAEAHDGEELNGCLGDALNNLKEENPALDWDYMEDRRVGELLYDIGITIQPNNTFPTVGLWRLDQLETFYGACGYLRGNIHHLNTMSLYGGLQAEMPRSRSERTHILYRQSYNLAYEALRKADNTRELFKLQDVYQLNRRFRNEYKTVMEIYSIHAKKQSFGVRDEYRVGGAAMKDFMEHVDDMVHAMMKSTPVLWLPSNIWFEFLAQRLKALKEQQEQLHHMQPPNYGILTGLHQFLMQSIVFTPPITETFVRNALYLLRYQANIARQGMFFLHELDLTLDSCHPELPEKDDLFVIQRIGVPLQEKRKTFTAIQQAYRDVERYPIGNQPSWKLVTRTIQQTPWILMKRWEWPQELENIDPMHHVPGFAAHIFVQLTQCIWMSLHDTWSTAAINEPEQLQSLKDAMNCWSLESVYQKITKCQFTACNSNLGGAVPGRRHVSFQNRRIVYLPKEDENPPLPGLWITMTQEPGYLFQYWEWCRTHTATDIAEADDILDKIFSYCQCLPSSRREQDGGQPWEVFQGSVRIITNPKTYKIDAIGTGRGSRKARSAPAVRTKGSMLQKLLQHHGVGRDQLKKAQYIQRLTKKILSRKTSKARNKRKPPKYKERMQEGRCINNNLEGNEKQLEEEAENDSTGGSEYDSHTAEDEGDQAEEESESGSD
ncbi:hypothetical protein F5887DRAFT_902070 [Amanita rubescens]|nr:hypothetical protein F5887DRAFT_902070 [Amanita rubescens]